MRDWPPAKWRRYPRCSEAKLRRRVRSALKPLCTLAANKRDEVIADWLLAHPDIVHGCRTQWQATGDMRFLGEALDGISRTMEKRLTQHEPVCPVCNQAVGEGPRDTDDFRSDARYCSAKCKQKAYRRRVTANRKNNGDSRNDSANALRLEARSIASTVTHHSEAA